MLTLGNKLTLNSSKPIYHFVNKYSIDFDGVDDRIITDGADTVAQPTTYSFWAKTSQTTQNFVFGHGNSVYGSFVLNHSGAQPLLWLNDQYYRYWINIPQQDDGEWHHWVVYSDTNDITNSKLYCDGVLQTVYNTVTTLSTLAYTESLTIGGTKASGGNYFEGQIDEFAVYDRELTQAEITRMYNTYYSPNRVANGNFSQIGNEEVTNGDFSQEGSEQVTNGDFANWSGGLPNSWNQLGGSGDANNYIEEYQGKLRVVSNGGSGAAVEQNALTVGKIYKVTADLVVNSGGGMRFQLGANSTHHIYTTTQSIEFYAECDGTNGYLQIIRQGTTDFTIDNVSVKEVGQNWTFANDATMGNDVATIIGDSSTAGYIIQDNVFQSNKTYKCIFDVTINSGLGLKFQDGLSYSPHNENIGLATTSGVYTFYFNSTSYNQLAIIRRTGGTAYDSIINSVSVKQVDPNDRWSLGTGWSIEDGKLKGDGTNTDFQSAQQNNVTTVGDTYEVTVTVEATSGAVELKGSGVYTRIDSLGIGTHTFYVVADATYIRFLAHASSTITLDNFTVREYAIQPQDV